MSFEFPPHTHTGGIGSYMLHLANLLHEYGHNVSVFSALPGGNQVEVNQTEAYTNYCIPAFNNEEFRKNAADFFERYKADHRTDLIESPEVGACALEIKKRNPDIPLIVKMHTPGVLINKISRYYQPLFTKLRFVAGALLRGRWDKGYWATKDKNKEQDKEYQLCMLADKILSPSAALKNWAVDFWQLPAQKITVVPNPFTINDDMFSLTVEGREKIISFVGKLSVLKGMIVLTEAIPLILDKNPGYKIFLVGRDVVEDGKSMRSFMEKKLAKYSSKLIFTGHISPDELKQVYAKSQICIFPSLWENSPNVIFEAMAGGCAVVASDAGGIREIITEGTTGLLFNPTNSRQLSMQINKLINNNNLRVNIADGGRKKLKDQMSNIYFQKQLVDVYS